MMEEAQAGEDHGDSKGVTSIDDGLIADGTSRLSDVGNTAAACPSNVIVKGEEGIACQRNAGHVFQPVLFFLGSEGGRPFCKEVLPYIVPDDVLIIFAQIYVDGIIPIRASQAFGKLKL